MATFCGLVELGKAHQMNNETMNNETNNETNE